MAITAVLSLSGFSLAAHLHRECFDSRRVSFAAVYLVTLAGVGAWGVAALGAATVIHVATYQWALAAGLGAAAGIAWAPFDPRIVRLLERRRARRGRARDQPFTVARTTGDPAWAGGLGLGTAGAIGALEEIVYRGLAVQLCFEVRAGMVTVLALCATTVLFGLSHIEFGSSHVIAKTALGFGALVGTLVTGTVLFAVGLHTAFNVSLVAASRRHTAVVGALR